MSANFLNTHRNEAEVTSQKQTQQYDNKIQDRAQQVQGRRNWSQTDSVGTVEEVQ